MHPKGHNLTMLPAMQKKAKITKNLISRQQSLRGRLLTMLSVILLFTLLMIELSVSGFVTQTEQVAWKGRQGEAARNAADTVAAFVQRVNTTLTVIAVL